MYALNMVRSGAVDGGAGRKIYTGMIVGENAGRTTSR